METETFGLIYVFLTDVFLLCNKDTNTYVNDFRNFIKSPSINSFASTFEESKLCCSQMIF